jgi:hypothetical protein
LKRAPRRFLAAVTLAGLSLLSACGPGNPDPLALSTSPSTTAPAGKSTTPPGNPVSSPAATAPAGTTVKPNPASGLKLEVELPAVLETLETLIFKVKPNVPLDQIPKNTQWRWEFGDGSPPETKIGTTEPFLTGGHRYNKNGDYQVKVSLVDLTTKQELASAAKGFIVSDIASIRVTNHLQLILSLSGLMTHEPPTADYDFVMWDLGDEIFRKPPYAFEWTDEWRNGSPGGWRGDEIKFKGSFKSVIQSETGTQTREHFISGTISVSPEGMTLSNYYYVLDFENPNYKNTGGGWTYGKELKLKPIAIAKVNGGASPKFQFRAKGYEPIYNCLTYAGYSEHFYDDKERYWSPQPRETLTQSNMVLTFETLNLNR